MGKTTVILLAAFLAFIPCAHGQTIAPQWTWQVSSDFGPRLVPGYDPHEGVDFNPLKGNADLGTPIPNLEGGLIFTVANNATFLEVQVQGRNTGHMWLYGHIFRNGVTNVDEYGSTTRSWELRKNARLVLPSDTSDEISHNVIIRWDGDNAISAITSIGGDSRWIVDDQGYCVQDANQNCIEAKAIAEAGDLIAPMGDAETTNVHLHLGLNYPDDNPYLDLQHPPDTLPAATILQPADGHIMTAAELDDYGFKARIDSVGGLDLDKVSFWIYKNKDSAQAIHLGPAGLPTFGYGGRAGENQNGLSYSSDGEATGVQPISDANGDTLGHDKFIFRQNLTALNLPDGEHSFVVRLKDVNGNEPELVKTDFAIDRTGPAVTINTGFGEPYRAFTGESLKTPVSPNPGLAIDGKLKITIADSGAGVKSFVLEKPSPEASLTEDADAGATTVYKELTGLSNGTYTLTAYDNNNNKTVVSFTLSDLALEPKISESASVYKTSDYFDASLRFKTAASLKIKDVVLYDSNGAEISRHASTSTAEMVLYQLTDLFNTTDFSRNLDENPAVLNYSVVLTDNESQKAKHRVSLELEKLNYPINLASQDSGETEISQLGCPVC